MANVSHFAPTIRWRSPYENHFHLSWYGRVAESLSASMSSQWLFDMKRFILEFSSIKLVEKAWLVENNLMSTQQRWNAVGKSLEESHLGVHLVERDSSWKVKNKRILQGLLSIGELRDKLFLEFKTLTQLLKPLHCGSIFHVLDEVGEVDDIIGIELKIAMCTTFDPQGLVGLSGQLPQFISMEPVYNFIIRSLARSRKLNIKIRVIMLTKSKQIQRLCISLVSDSYYITSKIQRNFDLVLSKFFPSSLCRFGSFPFLFAVSSVFSGLFALPVMSWLVSPCCLFRSHTWVVFPWLCWLVSVAFWLVTRGLVSLFPVPNWAAVWWLLGCCLEGLLAFHFLILIRIKCSMKNQDEVKSIVGENQPCDFEVQSPTSRWVPTQGESTNPIQKELYKIQERMILSREKFEKKKNQLQVQFIQEREMILKKYEDKIQELDFESSTHQKKESTATSSGDEFFNSKKVLSKFFPSSLCLFDSFPFLFVVSSVFSGLFALPVMSWLVSPCCLFGSHTCVVFPWLCWLVSVAFWLVTRGLVSLFPVPNWAAVWWLLGCCLVAFGLLFGGSFGLPFPYFN
ncbi:hypothetical protein IEQ34_001557 [Dendrobium chrysotoxum]|uniref:Uncharacterized protein n=1 Tax=Dendrobium chrysotoxum TaxID=161865 RepID=A0AAV7HQE3_DENCH|nr:hypothetical protein IEQ34_001557 [Dendrobium chrysotoxum]